MAEPLVDRHFLERLERLTLHWQKSFNGLVGGHNLSHFAGPGQEFLDPSQLSSGRRLARGELARLHAFRQAVHEDVSSGAASACTAVD